MNTAQPIRRIASVLLLAAATFTVGANDGGIEWGGSPKLLKGHPSVQMVSEHIKIEVQQQQIVVVADFVFKNHGKATTVRMGFPDFGEGASDVEEGSGTEVMKTPPPTETPLRNFESWVNGKKVKTELIRADRPGAFWRAKSVSFKSGETIRVRDRYLTAGGAQITMYNRLVKCVPYIVHTGSSWRGNIGSTLIDVKFRTPEVKMPLRPHPISVLKGKRPWETWIEDKPGTVIYSGFKLTAVGRDSLRFERKNWRPQKSNDLMIFYLAPKFE
jgi:hypothetical protein